MIKLQFVEPIRSKEKILEIKAILKKKNFRDYVLFSLGINSGLKIHDLLNLRIKDVLTEEGFVKEYIDVPFHGEDIQCFHISRICKAAISDYLQNRSYDSLDEPLFVSKKQNKGKQPLLRQQAYKIINDAARLAGLTERIGTHTLRKTFGYHAYQSGVPVEQIQKMFHHSSPNATLHYIGVVPQQRDHSSIDLNL
ncbi:tyrosine-type recombinase/integrase [Priestia endophytica]|uniref:tyrosine-type recombinase/integrase n=1 Tax=Priestia endophytica TaxID=135735 RepID=UPI00227E3691|nr:tyrosine-type recombinase/integrase [Priestia endophytica]MCY8234140.1 tyrosine-type recombinase/integrase [Priestia endophytica]